MCKPSVPSEYRSAFAKRLRVVMAARNVRVSELSKAIGVSAPCLYSYCEGKAIPTAYTVAQVCTALDVDANELLGVRR